MQPDLLEELFFSGLIGSVQIDSVIPYILNMQVGLTNTVEAYFSFLKCSWPSMGAWRNQRSLLRQSLRRSRKKFNNQCQSHLKVNAKDQGWTMQWSRRLSWGKLTLCDHWPPAKMIKQCHDQNGREWTLSELNAKLNLVTKPWHKIHSGQTNFEIQISEEVLCFWSLTLEWERLGCAKCQGRSSVVQRSVISANMDRLHWHHNSQSKGCFQESF